MPLLPRLRRAALVAGATLALGACATTYDASLATDPESTTTTSTLPTGPAADLLPRLSAEAGALSTIIQSGGDAQGAVTRIQQLWQASKTEVNSTRPDLLFDFGSMVDLCARAARFDRAADADKAAKNLDVLVATFLGS